MYELYSTGVNMRKDGGKSSGETAGDNLVTDSDDYELPSYPTETWEQFSSRKLKEAQATGDETLLRAITELTKPKLTDPRK